MAEKKRPRRTRERILETSLALFNRFGEPHITTADIADEMNISPGNLYYHFRNKDEIIGDLYGQFEVAVAPLFVAPEGRRPDVEDLWLLLHLLFERMWEYRFLFRDLDELTSRSRRIATRFASLVRQGETTVLELFRGMVDAGTMQADARELAACARNVVIVATYWMSYERISRVATGSPASDGTGHFERAAHQVLALIAPFLVGDARALIESLGERYMQGN
jgi:AcrR family transcriptional regulator